MDLRVLTTLCKHQSLQTLLNPTYTSYGDCNDEPRARRQLGSYGYFDQSNRMQATDGDSIDFEEEWGR